MENENNLELWNSVCTTDPTFTRPTKIGGHAFTAIDPQYQKRLATEKFGPIGKGWGVQEDGNSFNWVDLPKDNKFLSYHAVLWYVIGGERYEFAIGASIKAAYMTTGNNGYLKVDDDCVKKVRTNALTKGLADLGFNADVFLGKFDDVQYISALEATKTLTDSVDFIEGFQVRLIRQLLDQAGQDVEKFLAHYKVDSVEELKQSDYDAAAGLLAVKVRKAKKEQVAADA